MAVEWTRHRFSGGMLALDAANTVVLRVDPVRSFDRFADRREVARFAAAATACRPEEFGGRSLHVSDARDGSEKVIVLREATDRLFRASARHGAVDAGLLPPFLAACAGCLQGSNERFAYAQQAKADAPLDFEVALAWSALSLLQPEKLQRIRICRNCGWLFLDQSRNASRIWCDMAVCGNRQKARRHYRRKKTGEVGHVPHV